GQNGAAEPTPPGPGRPEREAEQSQRSLHRAGQRQEPDQGRSAPRSEARSGEAHQTGNGGEGPGGLVVEAEQVLEPEWRDEEQRSGENSTLLAEQCPPQGDQGGEHRQVPEEVAEQRRAYHPEPTEGRRWPEEHRGVLAQETGVGAPLGPGGGDPRGEGPMLQRPGDGDVEAGIRIPWLDPGDADQRVGAADRESPPDALRQKAPRDPHGFGR